VGVSERRACWVLGQARRTQRYQPKRGDDEGKLIQRMLQLVQAHLRYGYRRIWALLRNQGWDVNHKRIWRLWQQQGLKVPKKRHKKRRLGTSAHGIVRHPLSGEHTVQVSRLGLGTRKPLDGISNYSTLHAPSRQTPN